MDENHEAIIKKHYANMGLVWVPCDNYSIYNHYISSNKNTDSIGDMSITVYNRIRRGIYTFFSLKETVGIVDITMEKDKVIYHCYSSIDTGWNICLVFATSLEFFEMVETALMVTI